MSVAPSLVVIAVSLWALAWGLRQQVRVNRKYEDARRKLDEAHELARRAQRANEV